MSRAALNSWIAALLEAGAAPGTARIRQLAVRRFASWLAAGAEITTDPFPGVKAPRVVPPLVEPLTDDELRALITTCAVPEGSPDGNRLAGDVLHEPPRHVWRVLSLEGSLSWRAPRSTRVSRVNRSDFARLSATGRARFPRHLIATVYGLNE
jgi:hypothetical protein